MALISAMTELCGQNDEIRGAPQMKQLISLLASDETGGALDETGQDLVATSLKATEDAALLDAFVRSEAALKRLVKWLEASMSGERADQTRVLLSLFAHLPMTVEALMASKAGHVVNNARKVENEAVKKAAVELVKAWKAMSSGKPAAPKPPPVAKRPAAPAPAPDAKRVRPEAAEDEDFGLDSALSGAGAPRKASLKPDHLRARRPVQQLPSTLPSRSRPPPAPAPDAAAPRAEPAAPPPRPAAAPVAAPPAAAPAPPPPQPAAEPPASSVVARKPPSSKRVSWRGTEELVETREYIVEAKKAATTSWGDLLQAERERERLAMQQRLSADNDPWAIGGGDDEPAEAAPQTQTSAPAPSSAPPPRASASAPAEPPAAAAAAAAPASQPEPVPALVAWRTPPMLEDTFWPKAKGDDSSERDAQAARRKSRPEVSFRRMQDVVGMPAEPPPESAPPHEPVEIPFEKAATPDPPPAAAPAPLLTPAPHPPAGVGGGAPGGVGGVNIVGAGAQAMLLQQQQQLQQQRQQQQAAAAMQPFGGVGFGMMSGPQNGFGGGGGGGGRGGGGGGGGGLTERLMGSFMQQQQASAPVLAPCAHAMRDVLSRHVSRLAA